MESQSAEPPNDALVFHINNQDSQGRNADGIVVESKPLPFLGIISNSNAQHGTGSPAVEKIEVWANGVKSVIFVPLRNSTTSDQNPTESLHASTRIDSSDSLPIDESGLVPSQSGMPDSVGSNVQDSSVCFSRNGVGAAHEHMPNRCIATVAPQVNRDSLRPSFVIGSDEVTKLSSRKVAVVKHERINSPMEQFQKLPVADDYTRHGNKQMERGRHNSEVVPNLQILSRQRRMARHNPDMDGSAVSPASLRNSHLRPGLHTVQHPYYNPNQYPKKKKVPTATLR